MQVDAEAIQNQLLADFQAETGEVLQLGDERRIFLLAFVPVLVGIANQINDAARQNLLAYARGTKLDALAALRGPLTARLQAQTASVDVHFTLSVLQPEDTTIPAGMRVTPDGQLFFALERDLIIPRTAESAIGRCRATQTGAAHNGFAPGQISTIVDPIAFVASAANVTVSQGGADVETDEAYSGRIRNAPEGYSVAGPDGAYAYWAKTTDTAIEDVSVASPSPGEVAVTVLLKDGELPDQPMLDKVAAVLNDRDKRPLTDHVTVSAPQPVPYNLTATYYIAQNDQTTATSIQTAVQAAAQDYVAWQGAKLGRTILSDELTYRVLAAGARRIVITSPVYTEIDVHQIAALGNMTLTYGGLIHA